MCVWRRGESELGVNEIILASFAARHPGGQCPEKCRCGLDLAGLPAERGTERPALWVFEGELAKKLRPSKVSVGSVSPQGLAVSYYRFQAR